MQVLREWTGRPLGAPQPDIVSVFPLSCSKARGSPPPGSSSGSCSIISGPVSWSPAALGYRHHGGAAEDPRLGRPLQGGGGNLDEVRQHTEIYAQQGFTSLQISSDSSEAKTDGIC